MALKHTIYNFIITNIYGSLIHISLLILLLLLFMFVRRYKFMPKIQSMTVANASQPIIVLSLNSRTRNDS